MPRWKALPEGLDPQIREFTGRLRQLVDRSGLSVAALADRTGYSKTSWERYLGGGLLAPKGAVIALAEATGTHPGHLTTLWELAERAWSRAEMRHDTTMDALRISQARAALGETGATPEKAMRTTVRRGGGAAAVPGIAGPAGVSPTIPAQSASPGTGARDSTVGGSAARDSAVGGPADAGASLPVKNSWGLAGYRGPSQASARPCPRPPAAPNGPATPNGPADTPPASAGIPSGAVSTPPGAVSTPSGPASAPPGTAVPPGAPTPPTPPGTVGTPGPTGGQPVAPRPAPAAGWSARRQQVTMFFAGLFGVLALIAGVFFLTHRNGDGDRTRGTAASPSSSARTRTSPPPGVKCTGSACAGKDAEAMGCSGDLVTTAKTATVGTTTLEVRYSRACGTAWGRITGGAPGDTVRVTAGKERQSGDITAVGDTIGYTPMVAVGGPAQVRACATLASGQSGCTE